jgi:hypothetical protein
MDARGRRVEALRVLGSLGLIIGLAITPFCLITEGVPVKGFFAAILFTLVGVGLRLEAVITERP